MESLCVKFCPSLSSRPHKHFISVMIALFPDHPWDSYSCLQAAAMYWLVYNEIALTAIKSGSLDGWYKREETDACGVAALSGFFDENKVIYAPSGLLANASCEALSLS
eukprot:CAMPEP_0118671204 /NCGR_PEP_ID=MMETSP0785-20121206/21877_1 /TAXON_ID=91992 /ORGANISM="Bolidomonas pacifica, Strain CCMP 1866" /LENGTH=107 /DNA_ID=CAMNT_0006566073 /DNA_START=161 /DNA_END=480 /DNA_ORIENTATION=+